MKRSGAYKLEVGYFIYIGSSSDVDYRRWAHVTMLRKGTHPNPKLQFAWNQCPEKVSSSVLRHVRREEGESDVRFRDRLRAAEQELLDHFSADPRLTNISKNSRGPDKPVNRKLLWQDPVYREKTLAGIRNRKLSAETRARMSEAKKGLMNPKSRPVRVTWPDSREDVVFPSGAAAAKELNVSPQLIAAWLSGKSKMPSENRYCRQYWVEGVSVAFAE